MTPISPDFVELIERVHTPHRYATAMFEAEVRRFDGLILFCINGPITPLQPKVQYEKVAEMAKPVGKGQEVQVKLTWR